MIPSLGSDIMNIASSSMEFYTICSVSDFADDIYFGHKSDFIEVFFVDGKQQFIIFTSV